MSHVLKISADAVMFYSLCSGNCRWLLEVSGCVRQSTTTELACRYHMQATKGDNAGERPMWAEKGGLDFEGRAKWDAWTACKGLKAPKAQLDFVRVGFEVGHSSA